MINARKATPSAELIASFPLDGTKWNFVFPIVKRSMFLSLVTCSGVWTHWFIVTLQRVGTCYFEQSPIKIWQSTTHINPQNKLQNTNSRMSWVPLCASKVSTKEGPYDLWMRVIFQTSYFQYLTFLPSSRIKFAIVPVCGILTFWNLFYPTYLSTLLKKFQLFVTPVTIVFASKTQIHTHLINKQSP